MKNKRAAQLNNHIDFIKVRLIQSKKRKEIGRFYYTQDIEFLLKEVQNLTIENLLMKSTIKRYLSRVYYNWDDEFKKSLEIAAE